MDENEDKRLKDDLASIYRKRAMDYFLKRFFDEAILEFTKSLEIIPKDLDNLYYRAHAYYKEGSIVMAAQEIEKIIKLDPDYAIAYFTRGLILEKKRDWNGAMAAFQKYIDTAPPGKKIQIELVKKRLEVISNR